MKIRLLPSFLIPAALIAGSLRAGADILYVPGATGLYQFNTVAGPGSQTPVVSANSLQIVAIAVDTSSNVFVATWGDSLNDRGDIYEITLDGILHTVATGLNYPACLAVDREGNLFEGEVNYINEFVKTAGTLPSTPVIFANTLNDVQSLAFDSGGDLFMTAGGTYEFTNNAGTLSTNATSFWPFTSDFLAVDASGDLFVTEDGSGVYEFTNTLGTISSTANQLAGVIGQSLAFDSLGNLFIEDGLGNVLEYSNAGGVLSANPVTFAGGLGANFGLAFLPAARPPNLYVAGNSSVYSFVPLEGAGSQRTVASSLPFQPWGMAIDSLGNLFESDGLDTIYKIPMNGAPVVFATGLNRPEGLAFDAKGDLFEADSNDGIINEFINTAGTLSATPTLFASDVGFPRALAFDNSGNLFVADWGAATVLEFYYRSGALLTSPNYPFGQIGLASSLACDQNGDLFVGYSTGTFDLGNGQGLIEYVRNNSAAWYDGGNLSPTPVIINGDNVAGLAFDPAGNLYEVDGDNGNIYKLNLDGGNPPPARTTYAAGLGATAIAMNNGFQTFVQTNFPPNLFVGGISTNIFGSPAIYGFNTTNGATSEVSFGPLDASYYFNALALDLNGNLFGSDDDAVYELTNNAGSLSTNYSQMYLEGGLLFGVQGLAFDNNNKMFVGSVGNNSVQCFTNTGQFGVWGALGGLPGGASSLAFDASGNLFAADSYSGEGFLSEHANLYRFPPFSPSDLTVLATGSPWVGVAVDVNGNVFAGCLFCGSIYEFTNTPTGVSTNATLFASGLNEVCGLAFDANGNLFEADGSTGYVNEFINSGGTLSSTPVTFATGLGNATALAIYIPPTPPLLAISYFPGKVDGLLFSPAGVVISWPAPSLGWVLQTNSSLTTPAWGNYTGPENNFQGTISAKITPLKGDLSFRLVHP